MPPKKPNKKPITVKFDPVLLEELKRYQERLPFDTTLTALLESAVRQMLDREKKRK